MRTLTTLLACGLGMSLAFSAAQAEKVYRWTDAKGQVHFSSQPPRNQSNAEALTIKGQPQLGSAPSATTSEPNTGSSTQTTATTQDGKIKVEDKTKIPAGIDEKQAKENCRIATEHKKNLSENYNRRYQQADGSYRPLTDGERTDQNAKMDDVIKKYCTP